MSSQLCIIRHGETDWNRERRIQGQIDIPLNETGRAQALAMAFNAAHHSFTSVYSSDLKRAMETAQALAQREAVNITPMVALRERHYGIFQDVVKDEAEGLYPDAYKLYLERNIDYDFEMGESLGDFSKRTLDTFEWIARHHQQQTVAVICHAGLLDVIYRQATGRPLEAPRDFHIPNCALNWFCHDSQGWHLEAWDDHHHLSQVLMDSVE